VWLLAGLTVVPFAMTAIASLKSPADLLSGVFSLPSGPHFANYRNAWIDGHFGTYLTNSVIVVVPVVACSIALGGLAGFAMALLRLPGKPLIAGVLGIGMVMPTEAFIIPLYHEMHWLGLTNTYAALILPQIAQSLPFSTFFLATAMSEVPREVIEAAVLDGAPRRKVLVHVLLPLLASPVATLALFLFIWTWNEFLLPLILVNDERVRTLPVGMLFFQGRNTVNIPVLMAGAVITIAPIIAVFLTFQRRFISGLTSGSGK
jgi:raffinose/stachyose/melibiose transport system permease protein